jgi:hypothetical protein
VDRDDARFVADALASRIAGDRGELERLAASSLMQLSTLATRIKQIGGDWPPAIVAAAELMADLPLRRRLCDSDPPVLLQQFVDSMRKLAEEPPTAYRATAPSAAKLQRASLELIASKAAASRCLDCSRDGRAGCRGADNGRKLAARLPRAPTVADRRLWRRAFRYRGRARRADRRRFHAMGRGQSAFLNGLLILYAAAFS